MNRRQFLRLLGLTAAVAPVAPSVRLKLDDAMAGKPRETPQNDMWIDWAELPAVGYWETMSLKDAQARALLGPSKLYSHYSPEYKKALAAAIFAELPKPWLDKP